jgi:hypothetical protein
MNKHKEISGDSQLSLDEIKAQIKEELGITLEYENRGIKVSLEQLNSTFSLGEEISRALQANELSSAQLQQLESSLTSERKIFIASDDELKSFIESIGTLATRIDFDREKVFSNNQKKTALIDTLVRSMSAILSTLKARENGEVIEISMKDQLTQSFDIATKNLSEIVDQYDQDENNSLIILLERCKEIQELISRIDSEIKIDRTQAIGLGTLTSKMLAINFAGSTFTTQDESGEGYQTLKAFLTRLIKK